MDVRLLQELIECSVCLERMGQNSRVLPCQHTFCLACLEEIARTRSELRCPECRALVGVPVHDLPPNILLIRLLESMKIAGHPASGSAGSGGGFRPRSPSSSPVPRVRRSGGAGGVVVGGGGGGKLSSSCGDGVRVSREAVTTTCATATAAGRKSVEGSANLPTAKALYSYAGLQQGDLPLKRGDLVALKKRVDENWFYGECSGKSGYFPVAYVQVVNPLPAASLVASSSSMSAAVAAASLPSTQPPWAAGGSSGRGASPPLPLGRALYDFQLPADEEKDCLKLKKDDVISIIRRVDSNWLEGRNGDQVGIFPASYVCLNETAQHLVTASGASFAADASLSASPLAQRRAAARDVIGRHVTVQRSQTQRHLDDGRLPAAQPVCAFSVFAQTGPSGSSQDARDVAAKHAFTAAPSVSACHQPTPAPTPRSRPCQRSNSDVLRKPGSQHVTVRRAAIGCSSGGGGASVDVDSAAAVHSGSMLPVKQAAAASASSAAFVAASPAVGGGSSASAVQAAVGGSASSLTTAGSTASAGQKCIPIYVAVFNYKPQRDDELALEKGQLYKVSDICRDGWYRGVSLVTGQAGVFPGNYVQAVIRLPKSATPPAESSRVCLSAAPASTSAQGGCRQDCVALPPPPLPPPPTASRRRLAVPPSTSVCGDVKATAPSSASAAAIVLTAKTLAPPSPTPAMGAVAAALLSPRVLPRSAAARAAAAAAGSITEATSSKPEDRKPPTRELRPPWASAVPDATPSSVDCCSGGGAAADEPSSPPPPPPPRKRRDATSSAAASVLSGSELTSSTTALEQHSRGKHSFAALQPQRDSGVSPPRAQHLPLDSGNRTPFSASHAGPGRAVTAPASSESPMERYRCIASYPPQSEAELELQVGDLVLVKEKQGDGWYTGIHQRTSKCGLFPASFVEKT